jgi:hypothetical protein
MMYLENSFLFFSRFKKIRKNLSILVFLTLCGFFTACGDNGELYSPEIKPPPYDSAIWKGTWKGTNKGVLNATGHQIIFTANGITWSNNYDTDTIRFDSITAMWNYRESNKSDYPYGYAFQGTYTAGVDKGEKSWHDFYLKKDNTAIIYREGGEDAVFEKQ